MHLGIYETIFEVDKNEVHINVEFRNFMTIKAKVEFSQ